MLQSIWQDVQQQFRFGNRVTQIILVNIAVFVTFGIARIILRPGSDTYASVIQFFEMSDSWLHNLTHPWVLLSYGFLHEGFWHIIWNMLLFYWFGRIVGDLIGNQRVLAIYLWGVFLGGITFWLTALVWPSNGLGPTYMLGASAGVMATVLAAAVTAPEYAIRLPLLGEVRIKYIALFMVLLDILAFGSVGVTNQGGHFAHLGGAFMGYLFVVQLRNGNDMAEPVNRVFESIRSFFLGIGGNKQKRPKPTLAYKAAGKSKEEKAAAAAEVAESNKQERLDVILEKIKAKGIDSLSPEERDFLSIASRNNP
ncbi:MAG: rhomboid family intramembrane serine protease [Saprospiraceae bacterium]